jgi:hypothetical protein
MKKCSHVVIDLFRVLYYIAIGVGGLVRLADASQTYLSRISYSYQGRLILQLES